MSIINVTMSEVEIETARTLFQLNANRLGYEKGSEQAQSDLLELDRFLAQGQDEVASKLSVEIEFPSDDIINLHTAGKMLAKTGEGVPVEALKREALRLKALHRPSEPSVGWVAFLRAFAASGPQSLGYSDAKNIQALLNHNFTARSGNIRMWLDGRIGYAFDEGFNLFVDPFTARIPGEGDKLGTRLSLNLPGNMHKGRRDEAMASVSVVHRDSAERVSLEGRWTPENIQPETRNLSRLKNPGTDTYRCFVPAPGLAEVHIQYRSNFDSYTPFSEHSIQISPLPQDFTLSASAGVVFGGTLYHSVTSVALKI